MHKRLLSIIIIASFIGVSSPAYSFWSIAKSATYIICVMVAEQKFVKNITRKNITILYALGLASSAYDSQVEECANRWGDN